MAEFQKGHGFTAIPHELTERIFCFPFSGVDYAVIGLTIRYTWGYQRKEAAIALNLLAKFSCYDRANISRSIKKLINAKVLIETAPPKGKSPRHLMFVVRSTTIK